MMEIKVDNISKRIKGRFVLRNISVRFEGGKIYGIVGRNGSGKTMFLRALSGLMKIDEGTISLDGQALHKDMEIMPDTGLLLENAGLYPDMSGYKNLKYLTEIGKKVSDEVIREAIKNVGLDPDDRRPVRKYSLGMKQRLTIAQAVFEDQSLILLDEPTNALDSTGLVEIRNLLMSKREKKRIMIIASHNKDDIDILADEIYIMDGGGLERYEKDNCADQNDSMQ